MSLSSNETVSTRLPTENILQDIQPIQCIIVGRLPLIIADCCDKHENIVQLENKKHQQIIYQFPIIYTQINDSNCIFGHFNEVEYSTNIAFRDMKLKSGPHSPIVKMIRYYFNYYTRTYIKGDTVSSDYMPDSQPKDIKLVTRIDYVEKGEKLEVDNITVKLRMVKKDFRYDGVSYRLSGALEVPMNDFVPIQLDGYSKKREVNYWMIGLTHRKENFLFRVAFRRECLDVDDYVCNIECECYIDPASFIECTDLLYKYYKQQYIENKGVIQPVFECKKLAFLTKDQNNTLKTIKYIDEKLASSGNVMVVHPNMVDFIKYLGVRAFYSYVPPSLKNTLPVQTMKFENLKCINDVPDNFIDFENCNVTFDDI